MRETIVTRLRHDRSALPDGFDESRLVVAEYTTSGEAQLDYFATAFEAATSGGATSLRVVGDLWKLAVHISAGELAEYESRYHQLAHQFGVITRCHYDVRRFSGIELLAALRSHPDTLRRPPDAVLE